MLSTSKISGLGKERKERNTKALCKTVIIMIDNPAGAEGGVPAITRWSTVIVDEGRENPAQLKAELGKRRHRNSHVHA